MKRSSVLLTVLLCTAFAFGCAPKAESLIPNEKLEGSWLYVKKVENMPEDLILGMDASSVLSEEASGVKYYDYNGNEQDVFKTLAQSGVNTVRVRVWNDPYDENGLGYGGGNCDINTAVEIGKRATAVGMGLLVDFHLSDFWADPGKQMVPKAWKGMDIEEKSQAVYEYVRDSLKKLKNEHVNVTVVQVGNETNGALCGEKSWENIAKLMSNGVKAVREVFPNALAALHFANPETSDRYLSYAGELDKYGVDYDVFASSYYPYWHGSLENLAEVLNGVTLKYGKKVMVMETSYAYTAADTDFSGNTISDSEVKPYPFTIQGQANHVRDVIDTVVNGMEQGIGVVYWEGTWITVGQNSWEENHEKWEKYGSGWASSHAAGYDPDDAGKYYGGCAVDNQAMFSPEGDPLESLKVFNLVRYGNEVEITADAIEDTELFIDLNGVIELPEKVNAVMNDGSVTEVNVNWSVPDSEIEKMYSGGVKSYEFWGLAQGLPATLRINMVEFNFLENPGFETGEEDPWRVTDNLNADELNVEKKITDSKTGEYHYHFWSAKKDTVDFTLEQDVTILKAGTYKFSISIMGGDAGETDIYAYALVNGVEVGRCEMKITYYGEWDTGWVRGIAVNEGDTLTVGIRVKCAGPGAWGKIDDAAVNSEG